MNHSIVEPRAVDQARGPSFAEFVWVWTGYGNP